MVYVIVGLRRVAHRHTAARAGRHRLMARCGTTFALQEVDRAFSLYYFPSSVMIAAGRIVRVLGMGIYAAVQAPRPSTTTTAPPAIPCLNKYPSSWPSPPSSAQQKRFARRKPRRDARSTAVARTTSPSTVSSRPDTAPRSKAAMSFSRGKRFVLHPHPSVVSGAGDGDGVMREASRITTDATPLCAVNRLCKQNFV